MLVAGVLDSNRAYTSYSICLQNIYTIMASLHLNKALQNASYKLQQCKIILVTNMLCPILHITCNKCSPLLSISDPRLFSCSRLFVCLCPHAGTEMTPNYVDNSFTNWTISPWCDCMGSGNQEEECMNFLRYFTDNTCLSKSL